jgi:hypothetical protein
MARRHSTPEPATAADDFQLAAAAAEAECGQRVWWEMTLSEQTRAIYSQIRRMDEARAAKLQPATGRISRYRVAGASTRRMDAA